MAAANLFPPHDDHVASAIIKGDERQTLTIVSHYDIIGEVKLSILQRAMILDTGLEPLTHLSGFQVNKPLISALVERWSSKTNTFHLPVGEATITLEDVAHILCLKVVGKPICGEATSKYIARKQCVNYLGASPDAFQGRQIRLTWLRKRWDYLCTNNITVEVENGIQCTRCYLMWLIGCTIFPSSDKSTISPNYLPLFADLGLTDEYAWGAATLAHLYRALHKACQSNTKQFAGCAALLQVWAYTRFAIPRPPIHQTIAYPLVRMWKMKRKDFQNLTTQQHRAFFNAMNGNQMTWQPYEDISTDKIPKLDIVGDGYLAGQVKTWIIFYDVLEIQPSDRVVRQFGYVQDIPQDLPVFARDRILGYGDRKETFKVQLIEMFEAFNDPVMIEGEAMLGRCSTSPRYLEWFRSCSDPLIQCPCAPTGRTQIVEKAKVEHVCPICLTNPKDMTFGCGHLTCNKCGIAISSCPLCRKTITTRIKLYF